MKKELTSILLIITVLSACSDNILHDYGELDITVVLNEQSSHTSGMMVFTNTVTIYPNPFSRGINMHIDADTTKPVEIRISNKNESSIIYSPAGYHNLWIDFSNEETGVYDVDVLIDNEVQRMQILKTK